MKARQFSAVLVGCVLGICSLSGCWPGAAPSSETAGGTNQATGPAIPSGDGETVDPLAPILVTPGDDTTTAVVGDEIYFDLLESEVTTVKITTPDSALLEIAEASEGGGTVSGASATALAPGKATIVFTYPDGTTKESVVTIS